MNKISILLITLNESENIKKWGSWLPQLTQVNELVVVDGGSTDDTVKQIKLLSSKNIKVKIVNNNGKTLFSDIRNLGLSHVSNNLVLWLDADESPSSQLIDFLNHTQFTDGTNFAFRRQDIFLGHQLHHGETANQYFLRLFYNTHGKFIGAVHEIWSTTFPVTNLNIPILHTPNRDFRQFLSKINFYTELRAKELFDAGEKVNLFQIIFYPLGKFIQNYIIRLGFLDGTPGIILALSMSFHSFLVRAKLWTLLNP